MARIFACAALIALVPCVAAGGAGAQISPIQKVVQMMNDMMAKAKAEKQDEQVRFAQYKTFCEMTSKEKTTAIAEGTDQVEQLQAAIGQAAADAERLAKEIGVLNSNVATNEANVKKATAEREQEHKDFLATHKDYTESIESVESAVKTMKEKGGVGLLQTSLLELGSRVKVSVKAKRIIASFLQLDPIQALLQDEVEFKAPQAAAYDSASGGIVDMVEKLGDKFDDEREAAERKEMNMKQSYMMLKGDLDNQIEHGKQESTDKMALKAQREEEKAKAEGDLADTSQTLAEDQKFLSDLNAECEQKSIDYQKRQEVRQGELEAIAKAIEIMTSDAVTGAPATLAQTGPALAQLRSSSRSKALDIVSSFLEDRARASDSKVLQLIAAKAGNEPFKKVTKMIRDMITKLMEEANEEAEHNGFCKTEMGTNKLTRDAKTEEAASLKAQSDELTADIAKTAQELGDLSTEIAELDAGVAKATAEREAEKEKNSATIADAKVAQEATAQALQVLKDFYAKAANPVPTPETPDGPIKYDPRAIAILTTGGAASLAQVPGGPEMEGGDYKGMEGGGVVGMLEVIESDFSRVVSETTSSEADAQRAQEQFLADSNKDKAVKGANVKHLTASRTEKESELQEVKKDQRSTGEELAAALAYFEKLKPSCVDAGESYEERVARRKEEIESLQEALKILG